MPNLYLHLTPVQWSNRCWIPINLLQFQNRRTVHLFDLQSSDQIVFDLERFSSLVIVRSQIQNTKKQKTRDLSIVILRSDFQNDFVKISQQR